MIGFILCREALASWKAEFVFNIAPLARDQNLEVSRAVRDQKQQRSDVQLSERIASLAKWGSN